MQSRGNKDTGIIRDNSQIELVLENSQNPEEIVGHAMLLDSVSEDFNDSIGIGKWSKETYGHTVYAKLQYGSWS
jgi:hypothetical protein